MMRTVLAHSLVAASASLALACSSTTIHNAEESAAGAGGALADSGARTGGNDTAGGARTGGSDTAGGANTAGSTAEGGTNTAGSTAEGGAHTGGSTAEGGTAGGADTTPPTIVSVTPAPNSTGITAETPLRIEFSEPMAREAVEAATTVNGFAGELGFAWNGAGTILTLSTPEGWPYAEGSDPDWTDALTFVLSIDEAASDLAGLGLVAPHESSFRTLRRIADTLRPSTVLHYADYGSREAHACVDDFEIGRLVTRSASIRYYGLVGIDSTLLPTGLTSIESVWLRARHSFVDDSYYDAGGSVGLEAIGRASYRAGDIVASMGATDVVSLGILFPTYASAGALPLTEAFNRYWPNEHFYRLTPVNAVSGEAATLLCEMDLEVVYLLP